ncbi:tetratricopeptide repeat protein [Gaoshiqia sp. Z1-71]|uniref:tetratricopeptide repeat protein n=1 Tax=Gaoshiqia hydrogeniformans TaxID=3290090 RepID=UPI003BF7BA71
MLWGILGCLVFPFFASGQQQMPDANKLQLASRYYQSRDFDKAALLYRELYETTGSNYYFEVYLTCLVENADFETAEKEIKRELRRTGNDPVLYVQWAYLLKKQGRNDEAEAMFRQALTSVRNNKPDLVRLGNTLINRGEYEYAALLYREGRKKMPGENFHYELGRVYLFQRDYNAMFDEYLLLIREDETALSQVESTFQSALRMDVDQSLHEQFRVRVLKSIQQAPDVLVYNRLLIWIFMQEKNFAAALRQQIALDRRTGEEDRQIIELARIAGRNNEYAEALNAYDYMLKKGRSGAYYKNVLLEQMQLVYLQFVENPLENQTPETIASRFDETFQELGYFPETYSLILDYAHLLTFYMRQAEKAIRLLEDGMAIPNLSRVQQDELKTELADVQVYKGDVWEAVLLYSQVIERNKTNDLGDEAKLKKARLAYYMGDLKWAKAQLDVIKASTSKLVANDALELSLFIGNNMNLDTTQVPLQLFARADLYSFRNEAEKAWTLLDSIGKAYPYHSLIDDIYYRKANLSVAAGDYQQAAVFLEQITTTYPYDLLGDDAMFRLAGIYGQRLNRKEEAMALYQQLLVQYPGSVYVSEARRHFREMRGDFGDGQEAEPGFEKDTN